VVEQIAPIAAVMNATSLHSLQQRTTPSPLSCPGFTPCVSSQSPRQVTCANHTYVGEAYDSGQPTSLTQYGSWRVIKKDRCNISHIYSGVWSGVYLLIGSEKLYGLPLIHRPRRDGRLSWPGWLTHSGHFAPGVVTCQPYRSGIDQGKSASQRPTS